jgi:hypothetical protein
LQAIVGRIDVAQMQLLPVNTTDEARPLVKYKRKMTGSTGAIEG